MMNDEFKSGVALRLPPHSKSATPSKPSVLSVPSVDNSLSTDLVHGKLTSRNDDAA